MNTRRLLLILFSNNNERDDAQQRALSEIWIKRIARRIYCWIAAELPRLRIFSLFILRIERRNYNIDLFCFFHAKDWKQFLPTNKVTYKRFKIENNSVPNTIGNGWSVSRSRVVLRVGRCTLRKKTYSETIVLIRGHRTGTNEKLRIK